VKESSFVQALNLISRVPIKGVLECNLCLMIFVNLLCSFHVIKFLEEGSFS
jgi:hypothetical protein